MPRSYSSARQLERHAGILAVAREELAAKGYDGVTMNGLADKAGVVKKTLYNLYGSKDALLLAAIVEIISGYRNVGDEVPAGIAAIVASRRAAIQQILATPAYSDAMTIAVVQVDPDHHLVQILLTDSVDFTLGQLEHERARGTLSGQIDIRDLAEQIVSQGWGTTLLCMKKLIGLDELETKSIAGLLLLLRGAVRDEHRNELSEQLTAVAA